MYETMTFENCKIFWRNFSGKEQTFNPAGKRNFCLLLDPKIADKLLETGWNVKTLKPLNEDDPEEFFISINVNYKNRPPKIFLITSRNKTLLDESNIGLLDWADISLVDLVVAPSEWLVSGKSGTKGYVKRMYVTIEEDAFEQKYEDVPIHNTNVEEDDD